MASVHGAAAVAQPLRCEQLLPQKGELAYRLRGDRCEGLFIQDTSSSVRLKAFAAVGAKPAAETAMLHAALLSPSSGASHRIRVQSLDPRVHYQLDAIVPPSGTFSWPASEIVEKARVRRADLASLVWTTSNPIVYVPVSLGDAPASAAGSRALTVRATFESTVPIEAYVARLSSEKQGKVQDLKTRSALPATYLEFDLPPRSSPGHYTFWLRVRVLGEAAPEHQDWLLWLP